MKKIATKRKRKGKEFKIEKLKHVKG